MTGIPLVAEGEQLSDEELQRYARQLRMPEIGIAGQRRLKNARVLVVGAGGLGSPVILYLAGAGVGTIGIVDDDDVAPANLHRQILHRTASVGESKTASAADAVSELNSLVTVVEHRMRLDPDSAAELVRQYDVVVDGSDTFATRYAVSDATAAAGVPHVWGSVLRGDGQVTVFWDRGDSASRTLRDLFPSSSDDVPTCETAGVIGPLCGAIGSLMAVETLKLVAGFGEPLRGRVLVVDALDATHAEVPFSRRSPADWKARSTNPQGASAQQSERSESIDAAELAELLRARDAGESDFVLVDIREPFEREIVAIDGSVFIPMQGLLQDSARDAMPQDALVVLHCHHDSRSSYAREVLTQYGWEDVRYLRGGIHAWVAQVEPGKPTY